MRTVFRSVSLLALAGAALSAHAVVAYSNKPVGAYFTNGYSINARQSVGYLFTSSATGALTGFDVAINNDAATVPLGFTLHLFSNSGGTTGTLLGTYSGLSTGQPFGNGTGYASVAASGPTLMSGTSYWLVADSPNFTYWSWVDGVMTQPGVAGATGGPYQPAGTILSGAFSVNVTSTPGPLAALPFALMAVKRRRRKA